MEPLAVDTDVGLVLDTRQQCLVEVFQEFARAHTPLLETPDVHRALAALDPELGNVAAIFDPLLDPETVLPVGELLALYLSLAGYLHMRELWAERRDWGAAILRRGFRVGQGRAAAFFNSLGMAYDDLGDYAMAVQLYEGCIDLWHVDEDDPVLSRVYSNLGMAYWKLDDLDKAQDYVRRAMAMERQKGRLRALAMSLMNLAYIHYSRWEMAECLDLTRQAMEIAEELRDPYLEAQFTGALAVNMVANLMFDEAAPIYERALEHLAAFGDAITLARTRFNYALLCRVLKRNDQARQLALDALDVFERYRLPEANQARKLLTDLAVQGAQAAEQAGQP